MKNIDLTKIHYLSGPFEIETAEPGDVLIVEIQDVQPFQEQPWGFTGVFHRDNGGGFLDEIYGEAFVSPLRGVLNFWHYTICDCGLPPTIISALLPWPDVTWCQWSSVMQDRARRVLFEALCC